MPFLLPLFIGESKSGFRLRDPYFSLHTVHCLTSSWKDFLFSSQHQIPGNLALGVKGLPSFFTKDSYRPSLFIYAPQCCGEPYFPKPGKLQTSNLPMIKRTKQKLRNWTPTKQTQTGYPCIKLLQAFHPRCLNTSIETQSIKDRIVFLH